MLQAQLAQLIFAIGFVAHAYCHPYADPQINQLETLSISCFVASLWMGVTMSLGSTSSQAAAALSVSIVVLNAAFFIYAAWLIGKTIRDKYQEKHADDDSVAAKITLESHPTQGSG